MISVYIVRHSLMVGKPRFKGEGVEMRKSGYGMICGLNCYCPRWSLSIILWIR